MSKTTNSIIIAFTLCALVFGAIYGSYLLYDQYVLKSDRDKKESKELVEEADKSREEGFYQISDPIKRQKILKKALEKDPKNLEARLSLSGTYDDLKAEGIGSFDEQKKALLAEGLTLDFPPQKRARLLRIIVKEGLSEELMGKTHIEIRKEVLQLDPVSKRSVKEWLDLAQIMAENGEEGALDFIDKAKKSIIKYTEQTDYKKLEQDLRYLDYLSAIYQKNRGNPEQAADHLLKVLDYLNSLPDDQRRRGLPSGGLSSSYGDIFRETLSLLEKTERWEEIIGVLKSYYGEDISKPDRMLTTHKKLYRKAKSKIEGDER
ncbi:MAG: hypothetical protein ACLFN5_05835 [bacterium]